MSAKDENQELDKLTEISNPSKSRFKRRISVEETVLIVVPVSGSSPETSVRKKKKGTIITLGTTDLQTLVGASLYSRLMVL